MTLDFDSQSIGLPCPGCGQKRNETIGWFKAHPQYTCVCGLDITVDSTQFEQELARAQKALDDFAASITKIGKR